MTVLIRGDEAVDPAAVVGFFGDPALAVFGDDLYASYYLGTDFPMPLTFDYSYNGRELTTFGAPTPAANYVETSQANGYNAHFTPTQFADGGPITVIGVTRRTAGTTGYVVSSNNVVGNQAASVALVWTASTAVAFHKQSGTNNGATLNDDAFRGTGYEMLAGVWTAADVYAFRRHASTGGALASATNSAPSVAPAGAETMLLGAAASAGTAAVSRLVSVQFVRGDQSAKLEAFYQALSPFLANHGISL